MLVLFLAIAVVFRFMHYEGFLYLSDTSVLSMHKPFMDIQVVPPN